MQSLKNRLMRTIPSVDVILQQRSVAQRLAVLPRRLVVEAIRKVLNAQRRELTLCPSEIALHGLDLSLEAILMKVEIELSRAASYQLRKVINATGVILHTNLGRAVLAKEALQHIAAVGGSYSNLEYDVETGERGSRYAHMNDLLSLLTGAESSMVVNNNAGGVLLVLDSLAAGREVIVSRGELIEIGESFRLPDIMRKSGAILREVGTTNKTHLQDYISAISPNTALLLKVHTSNYRVVGFASSVALKELVGLGKAYNLPVVTDLGSGNLIDMRAYHLEHEPTVQEVVHDGADLITLSGDKLLGGPQAGIILGKTALIALLRKNALTRALRVDKLTLAGLEATLRLYLDEANAVQNIPTLNLLTASHQEIAAKGHRMMRRLRRIPLRHLKVSLCDSESEVGGGALPLAKLPTKVLVVTSTSMSCNQLEAALRHFHPAIVGRIQGERLLLDLRTVQPNEINEVARALQWLGEQSSCR